MQFHLDFTVDDLDSAEQATLALGATKVRRASQFPTISASSPIRFGHPSVWCV